MIDDILRVDWEQVQLKRAAAGLVAMLLIVAFVAAVGDIVLTAMLAALFTTASSSSGDLSLRVPRMVRFIIYGSVLGGLAFWSADSALAAAVVLGIATYVGTLAAAAGPSSARAGLFLTLWALFALMLGTTDTEPFSVTVAFLVGGSVTLGLTVLRLRASFTDDAAAREDPDQSDTIEGQSLARPNQVRAAIASPIGKFSLVRTAAVILAVLLGFWWFDSFPLWVAITVIVVVRPSATQSVSIAIQRTLGTAIGVGVAVAVSQVLPRDDTAVVIALLVTGFLMVAFNNANYMLFATFLTAMLVFGQRLIQADAFQVGWQRLLATAVGALIAIAIAYGTTRAAARSASQPRGSTTA